MFIHPDIDPVFFQLPVFHLFGHAIGPIRCYWYGLMYVLGFIAIWALANWRAKSYGFTHKQIDDLIFFAILGVILGGRLGYVLFYDFSMFLAHPSLIVKTWQGGMSFHGGLIGVMIALLWFAHREKRTFFSLTDFVAPFVPIGLGLGRIGNFINGELWGRVTHVPWAMVYPKVDNLPRHPSELYECALEGVVLFILMMVFSAKRPPEKAVSALFLIAYGLFRFCLEFFRMPDAQLGFIAFGWLTMGQLLCIPMILFGVGLWMAAYRKTPKHPEQTA